MSREYAPEYFSKRAVGRIRGKPEVNLSREVTLTFVRSIFENDYIIDDRKYHDIGTAAYYVQGDNNEVGGMIFACPGCGELTSIGFKPLDEHDIWSWNGSMEKPSCLPSILHNKEKGGCGWHGFVAAGRLQMQPPVPW
jgi:hypothetical protein